MREDLEIVVLGGRLHVLKRYRIAKEKPADFEWTVKPTNMDGDGVDKILLDHIDILKLGRSPQAFDRLILVATSTVQSERGRRW